MTLIWANSGDSHFVEPDDFWVQILPEALADRMPRSEVDGDEEIVSVDGKSFRRQLPRVISNKVDGVDIVEAGNRPPGARNVAARLIDLDSEGIWAEVVYPSLGLWQSMIQDPVLAREATRAENEWIKSEIQDQAPDRMVPCAQVSLLSIEDAVAGLQHAASLDLHAVSLPTGVPTGRPDYNSDEWEPLWAAAEEAGMVIAFHIGSDNNDADGRVLKGAMVLNDNTVYRGPGGALLNYVETSYGGQRAATKMVASGALDRHPGLKVLISEGGATWVPFLGDRMNEAFRQHSSFVRPKLSASPKEILFRQVYASFQHDESAVAAATAMGYPNVLWGSDYPHLEGTFGHTQDTLHELFDSVAEPHRTRMMRGAFCELFPHIGPPAASTVPEAAKQAS